MKTQIKQGKFELLNIPFHIYPDYRDVLSLFVVAKPNKRISGLLPLPNNPNTYRGDLYFIDKATRAIRFTLTFKDRLSGEIDVTELEKAILQYSKYPDGKKAYLQGVVVPQNEVICELPTNNTKEVTEQPKTRVKARRCKSPIDKLQKDFDKEMNKDFNKEIDNLQAEFEKSIESLQDDFDKEAGEYSAPNEPRKGKRTQTDIRVVTIVDDTEIEVSEQVKEALRAYEVLNDDDRELFAYLQRKTTFSNAPKSNRRA